jgi:hypothetical protein
VKLYHKFLATELSVEIKGEAVRLIAYALEKVHSGRVYGENNGF